MKLAITACVLLATLPLAPSAPRGEEVVARVLGEEVARSDLVGDAAAEIGRFRDLIWERVARHYVAERGLAATSEEIAELIAYHQEFQRRDRAQRTRKLEELNERLGRDGLAPGERAWLEEFRAVLTRLAQNDAENDRAPPPDPGEQAAVHAPWVELWKMNKTLYEQYGGTVALTRFGPAAHGARAALIAEYERRGLVRFVDPRVREGLFALLAKPPSRVVPQEKVDFTPYWRVPISPSYFPD